MKCLVLLPIILELLVSRHRVIWTDDTTTAFRQEILVDRVGGNRDALLQISNAVMRASARKRFVQVLFVTDAGSPLPKPDHFTYNDWVRYRKLAAASNAEFAEFISLDGQAVLRMRTANGAISQVQVRGTDPLTLKDLTVPGKITHFAFTRTAPSVRQAVDIFVQTDAPAKQEGALALLRRLEQVFEGVDVRLHLRQDDCFVFDVSYPVLNPFTTPCDVSLAAEHASRKTMHCSRASGKASCDLR